MSKLDEITQRWARMQRNNYNIGVLPDGLQGATVEPLTDPMLIVYSDRNGKGSLLTGVTAVCGPASDADSLEDAIAYAEAPTDVGYLQAEILRLKGIMLQYGIRWEDTQ